MLGKLNELILYVTDMAAQVRFYRDVLELPVIYPADLTDYSGEYWVELDAGGITLALHGGGTGNFGPEAPKFVFRVADIASARSLLAQRGGLVSEIRSPAPGVQVVDCQDPEGNQFSLETRDY